MAKAQEKVPFTARLKQIGQVFSFTAKQDKMFLPLVAGAVLIPAALTVAAVLIFDNYLLIPLGILAIALAVLIVLNLRAGRAMTNAAEGQPGAAASMVDAMRGDWRVTPAISSTTGFDMVHLVLGRPGVILLGEGDTERVRRLIGQEKKRLGKVVGSAPIYDFVVGKSEGMVPLGKLRMSLTKLPRNLTGAEVNALDKRLSALNAKPQMPKGAIPKNMRPGGMRPPRGR